MTQADLLVVWDYFKPRHTHAWNMLVLAWRQLGETVLEDGNGFETEYHWENFILRLWLYRVTVKTLARLPPLKDEALIALRRFDNAFSADEENHLKALRDMIEHFDDYAAGVGRGPGVRDGDLDRGEPSTKNDMNVVAFISNAKRRSQPRTVCGQKFMGLQTLSSKGSPSQPPPFQRKETRTMSKSSTTTEADWLNNHHAGEMLVIEFMEPLGLTTAAPCRWGSIPRALTA